MADSDAENEPRAPHRTKLQRKQTDSKLANLFRQLALSFLWVSIGFIVIITALLWHFADTVDKEKVQHSITSTESQLRRVGKTLAVQTKDSAWWSHSIENILVNKSEEWLAINFRDYLADSYGLAGVLVLEENYQPAYAERYGKEVPADDYLGFDAQALQLLINQTQASPLIEPIPYSGFIIRGAELYWVAACAMSNEDPQQVLPPGSLRPSLLFIRSFNDSRSEIAEEIGLLDMQWSTSANDKSNYVSLPIEDNHGNTLGYISWTLDLPGRGLLLQSLKWASPLFLCAVILAGFMLRRFRATSMKVENMTIEAALLKNSQQYFQSMADDAPVLMWETNHKAHIVYANKRFKSLLGRTLNKDKVLSLYDLVAERDREVMRAFFENSKVDNDPKGHEFRVLDYKGDINWLFVVCARQHRSTDSEPRYIFSANDVTERKAVEQESWYRANYDELTQLPNRSLFQNRLAQGLKTSARNQSSCALMFIDLDNFKNINDSLGHSAGDHVLQEAAKRIRDSIRETDTAARLGGDEFVLLLLAETGSPLFDQVANRVLKELAKPFALEHGEVYLSGSIGIAMYPEDGDSDETLMMNADTAMYHAKRAGRNQLSYYAPVMNAKLKAALQMEVDLRKAINERELFLVYQPIFNVKHQAMVGVEALVRWRRADGSLVFPDDFIPLAEQTGLIVPLGGYVLEGACQQLQQWHQQGLDLSMSINVSPAQLREEDFLTHLSACLQRYALDPKKIQLELTEKIFIESTEQIIHTLDTLSDLGVHLAIDDFGTGYSSLSYLQKMSVDVLKIDKSFMDLVLEETESAMLVKAMIAMAHSLNLTVVAEGVETQEQQDFLAAEGCERGQGYFYGRPVEPEQLASYFNDYVLS
ncbi:sensor domain-containing protein [Dasania marina]|uniref:sensor domain-containing protein n=1 Tax=Dasania marina TaxID=471499 RepID=UPI0003781972|nr:EAL domain-containing protein [Dasania marina]